MTNTEALERFGQAHGARIDKLFWIAGSIEDPELKSLLQDMNEKDFKTCFPAIFKSDSFRFYNDNEDFIRALIDFRKLGLIAEVHLPKSSDFKYQEGKDTPYSWSVHHGNCRVSYCYGETLEELMSEIEKAAKQAFQKCLTQDTHYTQASPKNQ